ncbi:hypothetical protein ANCDUO_15585 [Ancylostoma duodenale]|uniref:DNA topoisomerase n=1 Tax=Ancylostoma duodenale TaxID=51022 RepID=A0A0C2GBF8_9BILA|nr:hypothetical protein ANCDUO_15585 [Ancylostoma duodenale]
MTSTCGHVMTLDFPTKFNNWERVDPVDLYTAPTNKIEANAKMRMNDVIDAVSNSMKKPRDGDLMRNVYR